MSLLPTGTAFSRYLMILGPSRGDMYTALSLAERFKDSPTVRATLDGLYTKSAVSPLSTTDATAAGPLAAYGIAGESLQLLRGVSIIGALESKMRRVPFRTKVARETGSGTGGAWIGQGLATPVAATSYDTVVQEAFKVAKIVPLDEELLKIGDPDAERTVRETVIAGVAAYVDNQFLNPSVTALTDVRPASICNGATSVTSSGTTAEITTDLRALVAAVTTSGGRRAWIMRESTVAQIALALGSGAPDLPRTLAGYSVIVSDNSPAQITLVDAANILYSDTGGFNVDMSTSAAIELNDAPAEPTVASTIITSLRRTNRPLRAIDAH